MLSYTYQNELREPGTPIPPQNPYQPRKYKRVPQPEQPK